MERSQFTFYASFFLAIQRIKNKSARCDAYDALCAYALSGKDPDLDKIPDSAALVFELSKPTLDASRRKAESGSKGGNGKQNASKTQANGKQNASKKENEKENEKEIENECYTRELDFEKFWDAYPRKVNKAGSLAAFMEAGVSLDVVLSALENHKKSQQWTKSAGEFIPNPVTWLKERRWETELMPKTTEGTIWGCGELGKAELEAINRTALEE